MSFLLYVTLYHFLQNATIVLLLQERGLNSAFLIVVFIEFIVHFHEKGEKKELFTRECLSLYLLEFNKSTKRELKFTFL